MNPPPLIVNAGQLALRLSLKILKVIVLILAILSFSVWLPIGPELFGNSDGTPVWMFFIAVFHACVATYVIVNVVTWTDQQYGALSRLYHNIQTTRDCSTVSVRFFMWVGSKIYRNRIIEATIRQNKD